MIRDQRIPHSPVEILRGDILTTDQTDREGRLLAEYDAPAVSIENALANGVDMSLTPRALGGYRDNRLTSWGALRSMAPRWSQILNNLSWINSQYFEKQVAIDEIDMRDFKALSSIGSAIASFVMLRKVKPVSRYGELSVDISAIPKVSRGFMVLSEIVSSGEINFPDAYSICEANELFTSADGKRVCPGTYQMFSQAMDALFFGKKGAPADSSLNELIPAFPPLSTYSRSYVDTIGSLIDFEEDYNAGFADDKQRFIGKLSKSQERMNRSLGWNPNLAARPTMESLDAFYRNFSL
jgi:hypothetical protein